MKEKLTLRIKLPAQSSKRSLPIQFNYTSPFVLMYLDAASTDVISLLPPLVSLSDQAGHCSGGRQGFCGRGEDRYHQDPHLITSEN